MPILFLWAWGFIRKKDLENWCRAKVVDYYLPWGATCLVERAIRNTIRAFRFARISPQLTSLFLWRVRPIRTIELLEFPIRANHPIRANRVNRFARIEPLRVQVDYTQPYIVLEFVSVWKTQTLTLLIVIGINFLGVIANGWYTFNSFLI